MMARPLSGRIQVQGVLEALDPLHVGSGKESFETDLAVAVDGSGRVYVPGTSLAGALRHWCEQRCDKSTHPELTNCVWGHHTNDQGAAAHCSVDDGLLRDPARVIHEVRDHVGIDAQWGVAAPGIKFDRSVTPRGSEIDFHMSLDIPVGSRGEEASLLGQLLQALERGDLRIGAAKTRGLGRVRLKPDVLIQAISWNRQGLIDGLRGKLPRVTASDLAKKHPLQLTKYPRLVIEIPWQPTTPVMAKAGIDGLRVDTLPLLGGKTGGLAPLIPGSSLKGMLRVHAERILRTVLNDDQHWINMTGRQRFLARLDDRRGDGKMRLVQHLFGSRAFERNTGIRGALSISDCFADSAIGASAWRHLFHSPENPDKTKDQQEYSNALARVGRTKWKRGTHVAIDRWTGGAADNLLFQAFEPWGETWEPFRLEFDVALLKNQNVAEEEIRCAWVLLLLTLRDLSRNRIPIGFGGNRGLGEIEVSEVNLTPFDQPLGLEQSLKLPHGDLTAIPPAFGNDWIANFRDFVGVNGGSHA